MVSSNIPAAQQALAMTLLTMRRTGAILLGSWFSTGLLGMVLYQLGMYAFRFRHDRKIFHAVVAILTGLNIAHTAVLCQWQVNTLIYNFGDVLNLTAWDFLVTSEWALISSAAALTQLFYAWRVYALLSGSVLAKFLSGFIVIISLAGFGTGWGLSVKQAQLGNSFPVSPLDAIQWLFALAYVFPAVADLGVMFGMILGLRRVRKLSLPTGSHRAISHILYTAIEVNAVTTAMVLAVVISFALNQRPVAICIGACVPKVYQLTLVNSLLGRSSQDGRAGGAATGTVTSGVISGGSPRSSPVRSGVYVHTVRQVRIDHDDGHEIKVAVPISDPISLKSITTPTHEWDPEKQAEASINDGFVTPPSERVHDFA